MEALVERYSQGVALSGERRPEALENCIKQFKGQGTPVSIEGANVVECDASPFWGMMKKYRQAGDFGDVYEDGVGLMNLTRESRASLTLSSLCTRCIFAW